MGSYNSLEHLDRNWEQLSAVSRKWGRPSNGQKLPEVSLSTVKSVFDILWYFRCRGFNVVKHFYPIGGSPGLVVMGGDSCSKSREFKSWHRILDGRFFHLYVVKIVMCVWKDENKWKRGRVGPLKNILPQVIRVYVLGPSPDEAIFWKDFWRQIFLQRRLNI